MNIIKYTQNKYSFLIFQIICIITVICSLLQQIINPLYSSYFISFLYFVLFLCVIIETLITTFRIPLNNKYHKQCFIITIIIFVCNIGSILGTFFLFLLNVYFLLLSLPSMLLQLFKMPFVI